MEKISHSRHEKRESYTIRFADTEHPGCGFAFDATSDFEPIIKTLAAQASWDECVSNPSRYQRENCHEIYRVFVPAVIRCECGREMELADAWENVCEKCGLAYNGSGTEVIRNHRQWSEDWDGLD